ncbi:MAG: glycosyltransferase family 2 protein [Prevotella sp.]|nr:glycosyltransferase family 2 protein [Prevotella sp.]
MAYQVTIGIPVYNAENYIRQAIESALAQTFESIEFLILDDCGTDSSMSIVCEYQQSHSRGKDIRILSPSYNMGVGVARNEIVKETQGRYLFFMDADDTIDPNTIELLYEHAIRYQADIVFGSYERIIQMGENETKELFQYPFMFFQKEDEFPNYVYRKYAGIQATTWNFLIDIDILRNNHICYSPINYWEDFSLMIDLPTYITRAVLLPNITYHYYCRVGSASNDQSRDYISKEEINKVMDAIIRVKANSDRTKGHAYFPKRMFKVMMTFFYMICSVLEKGENIHPSFSNRELRDLMKYPLSMMEILKMKTWRAKNLMLSLLGFLPPMLSVFLMKRMGKMKGLIE